MRSSNWPFMASQPLASEADGGSRELGAPSGAISGVTELILASGNGTLTPMVLSVTAPEASRPLRHLYSNSQARVSKTLALKAALTVSVVFISHSMATSACTLYVCCCVLLQLLPMCFYFCSLLHS